jgi:HSP20 family protein
MNRLFRERSGAPALNAWTDQEKAVVTAELPGVNPDDLNVSVADDVLTIAGVRKWGEPTDAVVHRAECSRGAFSRSLRLPFRVDANRVQAACAKGVLSVVLPRAEQDKARRIEVKSA